MSRTTKVFIIMKVMSTTPKAVACYAQLEYIENGNSSNINPHSTKTIVNVASEELDIIPNIRMMFSDKTNHKVTKELNSHIDLSNYMTETTVILNHTNKILYAKTDNNFPIKIDPIPANIDKEISPDKHGFIEILTIYPVFNNNIKLNTDSYVDYIRELHNIYNSPHNINYNSSEAKVVIDYIITHENEITNYTSSNSLIDKKNSLHNKPIMYLKVVTVCRIDSSMLELEEDKSVYIDNKRLVLSTVGFTKMPSHMALTEKSILSNKMLSGHLSKEAESYSIYMIDNENKLGRKFANILNETTPIVVIKDYTKPEGLYIESYKPSVMINNGINLTYIELDKIPMLDFIFNSEEDAKNGRDKDMLNNAAIHKYKAEAMQSEKSLEEFKYNAKREIEEAKIQSEKETAKKIKEERKHVERLNKEKIKQLNIENKQLRKDNKRKTEIETIKYNTEKNKHKHENVKFVRESTMDMIKTGGLVISAALSIFMYLDRRKNA